MDRDDKIDAILKTIEDWDLDTLIYYVYENELRALRELSDAELEEVYKNTVEEED